MSAIGTCYAQLSKVTTLRDTERAKAILQEFVNRPDKNYDTLKEMVQALHLVRNSVVEVQSQRSSLLRMLMENDQKMGYEPGHQFSFSNQVRGENEVFGFFLESLDELLQELSVHTTQS
ncbi:hypothetical protein [Streptomyces sp. NBC_01264]|uniref:hypothetical protein n=1 Tax=Streptomyces sp. NBC_01264 TaxID=2903804 RepID=UPI002257517C|nr:hypothetical protein [Streptomyces sp. NBC_01264]MCX4784181.1 hypothetical protein [Streptomyces sp. NBC_01264]